MPFPGQLVCPHCTDLPVFAPPWPTKSTFLLCCLDHSVLVVALGCARKYRAKFRVSAGHGHSNHYRCWLPSLMSWVWSLNPMWKERVDSCRLSSNYHTCTGAPALCHCQTDDKDYVSSHHAQTLLQPGSYVWVKRTLGAFPCLWYLAWEHTVSCTHPGSQACRSSPRVRQSNPSHRPAPVVSHSAELEGKPWTSQALLNAASLNTQMWKWYCRSLNSREVWQLLVPVITLKWITIL